ncbi:antitoxin VapB family protein [Candidatus Woesearchaeota archaeon]|nr:antitoxin VapB family protein [Candidatus Woesearchaeota archaeon]
MVIKSLTITEDAYDALKMLKHHDESFSEIILRLSQEKIGLTSRYFGALKGHTAALRENIQRRRKELDREVEQRQAIIKRRLA